MSQVQRPRVRAYPYEDEQGLFWLYAIYLYDDRAWTGQMLNGPAINLLMERGGLTEREAKNKLSAARKWVKTNFSIARKGKH